MKIENVTINQVVFLTLIFRNKGISGKELRRKLKLLGFDKDSGSNFYQFTARMSKNGLITWRKRIEPGEQGYQSFYSLTKKGKEVYTHMTEILQKLQNLPD